jgi:hypothetical protein
MNQSSNDNEAVRHYLLGQLQEPEQIAIEDRLLMDDAYYLRLEMMEDELIDDYVSGALSEADSQAFASHFLAAPERQKKLKFAQAMHKYARDHGPAPRTATAEELPEADSRSLLVPKSGPRLAFASSTYFRIAASVILVIGAGLTVWRVAFYQSDVDRGLALMREVHGNERLVDERLSGFDYARRNETRGGGERLPPELQIKRELAERLLVDAVQHDPSARANHALGEFYLAERKLPAAIPYLEAAAKAADSNAEYHSDLGAALLEQGKFEKERPASYDLLPGASAGSETLSRSLAELNRALELNPNLLAALFNRALCHQALGERDKAMEDWNLYLQKDQNSRWADEAKDNLRLL